MSTPPAASAPATNRTLSARERIAYSVFNAADLLIKNLIGKYLFFFYTTTLGVPPAWIAVGQPLVKLLDVATDPLVGEWSDRTKHKMGRRRPWILLGAITLGIVFPLSWMPSIVMFWDPMPSIVSIFVYFLLFKLLYYVTHTVAVVPYYALGAELSSDYQERTKIVGWRHMIALPAVLLATLPYVIATNKDWFDDEITGIAVVMVVIGMLIIGAGCWTVFGTREVAHTDRRPPLPIKKALLITITNRPFMFLTATVLFYGVGQYFAVSFAAYLITYIIFEGDKSAFAVLIAQATAVSVVVGLLLNLGIRKLGERVEKVTLMKVCLGLSLLVPVSAAFSFNPEYPWLYFIFHALALPIGNTMIEILPLSIVADMCDIDEVKSHNRREGAFVGVYNAAFKSGYLLAPTMALTLLALTGFDGTLVQQTSATQDLLLQFMIGGTAVTFGLAFLTSLFVNMRKSDLDDAQAILTQRAAA